MGVDCEDGTALEAALEQVHTVAPDQLEACPIHKPPGFLWVYPCLPAAHP